MEEIVENYDEVNEQVEELNEEIIINTDSENLIDSIITYLTDTFQPYYEGMINKVNESLYIIQSMTFGEMVISLLLTLILVLMILRWIWETI